VICVGAWDGARSRLAPFSSRGDPARPETWPDVLAQGVDVIGPYPSHLTKSAARRARDEADPAFLSQVPPDRRNLYTLESGTSQAAATVTGAAAQILFFLRETIAAAGDRAGPLFEMTAPPDRTNPALAALPRLTGQVRQQADGSTVFRYDTDVPWKLVKQVLMDSAVALPGIPPDQGGAGLVDRALVNAQFGAYGLVSPQIAATKVTEQ
jgi:subtilisin family serine protease